jgi:hypothetical protein
MCIKHSGIGIAGVLVCLCAWCLYAIKPSFILENPWVLDGNRSGKLLGLSRWMMVVEGC